MENKNYKKKYKKCVGYTFSLKNALYDTLNELLGGYTGVTQGYIKVTLFNRHAH